MPAPSISAWAHPDLLSAGHLFLRDSNRFPSRFGSEQTREPKRTRAESGERRSQSLHTSRSQAARSNRSRAAHFRLAILFPRLSQLSSRRIHRQVKIAVDGLRVRISHVFIFCLIWLFLLSNPRISVVFFLCLFSDAFRRLLILGSCGHNFFLLISAFPLLIAISVFPPSL